MLENLKLIRLSLYQIWVNGIVKMEKNQGLILEDKRKNGKINDWQAKKIANLQYAELLNVLEFKKAGNVRSCAEVLVFKETTEGYFKLAQTWFCKSILCPMCNWRRAMKHSNQVIQVLSEAIKRKPTGRFLFWTLTTKNVLDGTELKQELSLMTEGFRRLIQYKKINKNLLGFFRAVEVTINKEDGSYNQHMHVLVFVKSTYFANKENYITQDELSELWQKSLKLDYKPVVHVQVVKPKQRSNKEENTLLAAAKEVAKYPVKSTDYLTDDEQKNLKIVQDLEIGLKGKRMIAYGGIFKEIRKELKLKDVEEAELITTDSTEDEEETIAKEIVARWNWQRKNYYLEK